MKHDKLKNIGQQLNTVKLIDRFVTLNLEELYSLRPRDIVYNPGAHFKNLDLIPANELKGRQVNFLE